MNRACLGLSPINHMGLEHKTEKILHAASQQQVFTDDILIAKAEQRRPANGVATNGVAANGVTSGYASMDSHSDSDGPDN